MFFILSFFDLAVEEFFSDTFLFDSFFIDLYEFSIFSLDFDTVEVLFQVNAFEDRLSAEAKLVNKFLGFEEFSSNYVVCYDKAAYLVVSYNDYVGHIVDAFTGASNYEFED